MNDTTDRHDFIRIIVFIDLILNFDVGIHDRVA